MKDTITVDDVTYDITDRPTDRGTEYTVEEFPGLSAFVECEQEYDDAFNPRDNDGIIGVMMTEYRGYKFGGADHDINGTPEFSIECKACCGCGEVVAGDGIECEACDGTGEIAVDPATWARVTMGATVVIPLFVYEHSGITMFAGAPIKAEATRDDFSTKNRYAFDGAGWDTSAVGIYFDTAESRKRCGIEDCAPSTPFTVDRIAEYMLGEIKQYDSFLRGEVYCYEVRDDETDFHEGCGGFVGDLEYVESECHDQLANAIAARLREVANRADAAARDIVTV